MNVFLLHDKMHLNVQAHCDKHVVKMPIEAAQILCTALHLRGTPIEELPYKPTHQNHPCVVAAQRDPKYFHYVFVYGLALCDEYTYRYKKPHKTKDALLAIEQQAQKIFDLSDMTSEQIRWGYPAYRIFDGAPLCMPEHYKNNNKIWAYRQYYLNEKRHIAKWTRRKQPYWMRPYNNYRALNVQNMSS